MWLVKIAESVLGRGVPALLPLIVRSSNEEIVRKLPSLPELSFLTQLPMLPGRDSLYFLLNLLRHIATRGESTKEIQDRLRRYLIYPVVASEAARNQAQRKYQFRGLGSLIMTPTVACNLRCEHCYNLYEIHEQKTEQLSLSVMRRVLGEAKALGAYRATIIGGEPLIRAKDLCSLAKEHSDVLFTVFTNGILLTQELAKEMASLGNIELAFSIDGNQPFHDRLRGEGSFQQALESMKRFREAGGLCLFSPTVTTENYQEILGDEYLETMKAHGAYMGYLHHYDLIGGQARRDWLLSKEQLLWMKAKIEEIHQRKDISVLSNVVSDLVKGGCPAVRDFVHINHKGEVEPCCMVPFAAESVYQKSLVEIMASPFFARLNRIAPDEEGIKRCLVGENKGVMQAAVQLKEAKGTTKKSLQIFSGPTESNQNLPTCFSMK